MLIPLLIFSYSGALHFYALFIFLYLRIVFLLPTVQTPFSVFVGGPIGSGIVCWFLVLLCGSWCLLYFSNHLAEEERALCIT